MNNLWTANNVKYKYQSLTDMFDYNIKIEEIAINEYTRLIGLTSDQSIIDIFTKIIDDEKNHLATFKKLKKEYT